MREKKMAVTPALIKELREKTGAGMMDCKKALTEADGDFEVDVSSSGDVVAKITGIDELEVEASSSGDVRLDVEAKEIEARVSSSGDIEIEGSARQIPHLSFFLTFLLM